MSTKVGPLPLLRYSLGSAPFPAKTGPHCGGGVGEYGAACDVMHDCQARCVDLGLEWALGLLQLYIGLVESKLLSEQ